MKYLKKCLCVYIPQQSDSGFLMWEEISLRHVLTYSSSHQSLHTKSHPFDKLLRPLDGSLENHR